MPDETQEGKPVAPGDPKPTQIFVDPILPQVRTRFQDWGEQLAAARVPTGGYTEVFEPIGRHQFTKMIASGLLPDHFVLDVGCGCLRAGYWLIHFLRPGHYCGIEPNINMLEAGKKLLMGDEIIAEKRPRFANNTDFSFGGFEKRFDFVLARSIWSHASLGQIGHMLDQFKEWTGDDGVFLTSWVPTALAKDEYSGDAFSWPAIRYRESTMRQIVEQKGLVAHVEEMVQLQQWIRITKR